MCLLSSKDVLAYARTFFFLGVLLCSCCFFKKGKGVVFSCRVVERALVLAVRLPDPWDATYPVSSVLARGVFVKVCARLSHKRKKVKTARRVKIWSKFLNAPRESLFSLRIFLYGFSLSLFLFLSCVTAILVGAKTLTRFSPLIFPF